MKIPIIIDCDPGVDDIAALILARQIENLDVKAVTTVAGNVPLCDTTANALKVLSFLNWDIPVGRGAEGPLCRPLVTAEDIHGKGGMSGLSLPETARQCDPRAAWDLIYDTAKANPGNLLIVAIGPLTNLAIALAKYPDLKNLLRRIVIMGGGIGLGNTTPAAEFNSYVDPEAAKRVFSGGVPFVLCPLNVTHAGYVTEEELGEFSALGSREARFFAELMGRYMEIGKRYTAAKGEPLHDPLALLFASDDSYFTFEDCFIGVETEGGVTRGKTVTDCYSDRKMGHKNGTLVQTVNRERFAAHIKALLSRYQTT
ncbi:MAG: nucleoside hydrolase [Firmicutes bacterium]|nr:nucleoside hydrolase [Bacillota bacterium]